MGVRQSGMLEFQLADIYTDAPILKLASEEVQKLLSEDEKLEKEENKELKQYLQEYMEQYLTKLNI